MKKENVQRHQLSRVNEEIVVGQDEDFEKKWWRFETRTWGVMVAVMIFAAFGGLGRGLLSKGNASTPDGMVQAQYDRILHFRTPGETLVHVHASGQRNGRIQLWINRAFYKDLQIQNISPRPVVQAGASDGAVLTFWAAAGTDQMDVRLVLQPGSVGIYPLELGITGGETVRFHQLVVP